MNDNELPEKIRQALKAGPERTPPESFYRSVMDHVRAPKQKPFFMRWPVHAVAAACLVFIVVWVNHDQVANRQNLSAIKLETDASPALQSMATNEKIAPESAITDKVTAVLQERKQSEEMDAPMPIPAQKVKKKSDVSALEQGKDNLSSPQAPTLVGKLGARASNERAETNLRLDTQAASMDEFAGDVKAGNKKQLKAVAVEARDPSGMATQGSFRYGLGMSVSGVEPTAKSQPLLQKNAPARDQRYAPEILVPQVGLALNWKGQTSGIHEPRQVVLRDTQAWQTLWREHQPGTSVPPIDFARYMVVGVFLGERPNPGHELEIVDLKTLPDQIALEYQESLPKEGMMYADVMVQPYALKVIPKTELYIHFHYMRPKDR